MATRNPSEIQRKTEELEHHRKCVADVHSLSKKSREYHLGEVRRLCDELGKTQPGNYNGG